jgi:1-aminocyclopropane-1-carboxylate deaminase/D-cysteine desulfhydrase-like pyridoxal-dependent ACC family enzyme
VSISLTEKSSAVVFGSFNLQTIDMADVRALGNGTPFSAAGTIAHEVTEQTQKQAANVTNFQAAHATALKTSNAVDGATEMPSQSTQTGNTVVLTVPYSSPTGPTTKVEIDLVNSDVTCVVRPPL